MTLPANLEFIGEHAFSSNQLASVTIPDTVREIGDYAFANNQIEELTYDDQIFFIGMAVFNNNAITKINGNPSDGFITDRTGKVIISYGGAAKDIASFPEGAVSIGEDAFTSCNINSVVFPEGLTDIGPWSFTYNNITHISLPSSLVYIGIAAFYDNPVQSYILPENNYGWMQKDGVLLACGTEITDLWDQELYSLIPYTLTENDCQITSNDDNTCTLSSYKGNAVNIIIPEKLSDLTVSGISWGFNSCNFVSVALPDTITHIGGGAFSNNYIATVNGEPSNGLFYAKNSDGSDDMTKIVSYGGVSDIIDFIPDSVTTIDYNAFNNCGIQQVVLPESLRIIGGGAFRSNKIESIKIPSNVKHIGYNAFYSNSGMAVEFPEGLLTIGESAFASTNIENVKLPSSLIYIGSDAFGYRNKKYSDILLPDSGSGWYVLDSDTNTYLETTDAIYERYSEYTANADYSAIAPEDIFIVEKNTDGTCKIVDFYVYNADLVIPSEISNMTVTCIGILDIDGHYIKSIVFPETLNCVQLSRYDDSWYADSLEELLPDVSEGWTFVEDLYFKGYLSNAPAAANESEFSITDYGNGTCRIDEYTGVNTNLILPKSVNGLEVIDIKCAGLYSKITERGKILYGVTFPVCGSQWINGHGLAYSEDTFYVAESISDIVVYIDRPRVLSEPDFAFTDNEDGTLNIEKYLSSYTDIIIPESIGDKVISSICDKAFMGKGLTSVVIPDSVKSIGSESFISNKLTDIVLPASLEYIGDLAFNNNSVTYINNEQTNGLIYARNSDGTEDKTTIVSYCGTASIIDFIPAQATLIKANVFSGGNISKVYLQGGIKGWSDSTGKAYSFNAEIEDYSLEYSANSKAPIGYFMGSVWSAVKMFVLSILSNPYILALISIAIFLILLVLLIAKNAKLRKKYKNAEIDKKEYRGKKRKRFLLFVLIIALIFAADIYLVFFSPDFLRFGDASGSASGASDSDEMDVEALRLQEMREYDDLITLDYEIHDLSEIEGMTELERIQIDTNVSGDLSSLSGLTNLKVLEIDDYPYGSVVDAVFTGDLSSLSNLKSLEVLVLRGCENITGDLSQLSNMSSLNGLTLSSCNQITGDLSSLSNLVNLKILDLFNCPHISGSLYSLSSLNKIVELNLSQTEGLYGDLSELSHMTYLEMLNLRMQKNITGSLLSIKNLTSLNTLDFYGCDSIELYLEELIYLPKLADISLKLKDYSGSLSVLSDLTELRSLELYAPEGAFDISYLGSLSNLRGLSIRGMGFYGDISSLNTMSELYGLHMSNCSNITGDIGNLSNLENLGWVYFSDCEQLTGSLDVRGETITPTNN